MRESDSLPESRHEPGDALVPETPAGYREPTRFDYSVPALTAIAAVLVALSLPVFGAVLWVAQGAAVYEAVFLVEETPDGFVATLRIGLALGLFAGTVLLTVVVHELVHGLVYRRFGYEVTYGVAPHLGAAYAGAFHQFQRPRDVRFVVVAPLLVLDAVLLALLFVPVPLVAFAAFVGLVFNTAGAAGDLYLLAYLARLPAGTLLYDSDVRHSYVFEPES